MIETNSLSVNDVYNLVTAYCIYKYGIYDDIFEFLTRPDNGTMWIDKNCADAIFNLHGKNWDYDTTSNIWINRLIDNGYKLSSKQKKQLLDNGWCETCDMILKRKKFTQKEFNKEMEKVIFQNQLKNDIPTTKKIMEKFGLKIEFPESCSFENFISLLALRKDIGSTITSDQLINWFFIKLYCDEYDVSDYNNCKNIVKMIESEGITFTEDILEKTICAQLEKTQSDEKSAINCFFVCVVVKYIKSLEFVNMTEEFAMRIFMLLLSSKTLVWTANIDNDFYNNIDIGIDASIDIDIDADVDDDYYESITSEDKLGIFMDRTIGKVKNVAEDKNYHNFAILCAAEDIYCSNINPELGFKYALLNRNIEKAEYYLDQKIVPNNNHLSWYGAAMDYGVEFYNIIEPFINYGFVPDANNYKIIVSMCYPRRFEHSLNISEELCNQIREYGDLLFTSCPDVEKFSTKTETYKKPNPMSRRKMDIHNILIYSACKDIDFNKTSGAIDYYISEAAPNVYMYLCERYNHKPHINIIIQIKSYRKRIAYMNLFYPELC